MINAALALAAKPNSKVAQDNMDLFKEQWEKQVRVLTDAVDDITSIDDFLSVSGKHRPPKACVLKPLVQVVHWHFYIYWLQTPDYTKKKTMNLWLL